MKAWKTRARIFAGFGAAIILLVTALSVSVCFHLQTIRGIATRLTKDAMPCIYLIVRLHSATLLRYTLLVDRVDSSAPAKTAELDRQIDLAGNEIASTMGRYEKLIDDDRQLFDNLKSASTPYADCFARVLRLTRQGKRQEALDLLRTRLVPLRDAFLEAAEAEVARRKADADDTAGEIMAAVSWTSTGILLCVVLSAGVTGIAHDIYRRLRAGRKLREDEERFRGVFEHAPSGIAVHAPDGRFIQVNAAFGRILGYSEPELLATLWPLLVHPDDLQRCRWMVDHLSRAPGGYMEAELRYLARGGTVVWGQTRMSAVRDSSGNLHYVVVHLEDITERRRAEEALRESERRFRIMADGCPTIMWVTDANCCLRFVNRTYREYFGITSGEVEGNIWQLLIHPDDAPRHIAAFKRAASEHTSFTGEARFRRADGEWRLLASDAAVRLSSEGELLGHVGVSTDITDRTRSEQERQFQHSLIQAIHEVSPDGILVVNDAGVILSHNRMFLEVWRNPMTDILGTCVMSGSPDESLLVRNSRLVKNPEAFLARIRELYADPAADDHSEIELLDGRILERDSTSLRSRTGQHLGRVWFIRDITEASGPSKPCRWPARAPMPLALRRAISWLR
jgi:PAS domain S-box-containing protein